MRIEGRADRVFDGKGKRKTETTWKPVSHGLYSADQRNGFIIPADT